MQAIHVRTADRGADDAIAAWFQDHDVDVIDCADAFDACVAALTPPDQTPELAFVGVDWISPEESGVLGYLRETWPRIVIVIHGGSDAAAGYPAAPLTLVCRTSDALAEILAHPPAALRSRVTDTRRFVEPTESGWRPTTRLPTREPASARRQQTPDNSAAADANVQQPAPPIEKHVDPPIPVAPRAHVTSLTAEELAALLEDWEPNRSPPADV